MAMDTATLLVERTTCGPGLVALDFFGFKRCCLAQPLTFASKTIPTKAATENQAMLDCPLGSTMKAASKGPSASPALPPTWKSDCAKPCCPPEAIRATREDSG